MSTLKKICIAILAAVIILPATVLGYMYFKLNSMYDKDSASLIKGEQTQKTKEKEKDGVTNVLLVGVDGNNLEKGNRSDAMMVLTIDERNSNMRLTSLARDTYVDIPGYSTEKLTHAYAYGGPSLLLQTIEQNFNLPIDKYAAVSFKSFEKIIDIIGGVEIDILEKEVPYIDGVSSAGVQTLSGKEALDYSRIRYADSAYQRDNRQRTVIQAGLDKLLANFSSNFMEVGNSILEHTKTNVSPVEIVKLANKVIKIKNTSFDQMEFPLEGHREGKNLNKEKGWIIEWEKDYNIDQLDTFIYNYENYKK